MRVRELDATRGALLRSSPFSPWQALRSPFEDHSLAWFTLQPLSRAARPLSWVSSWQ